MQQHTTRATIIQHPLQGLDTEDEQVLVPKVVEALLGTRFRGREFSRGPLVRIDGANTAAHSLHRLLGAAPP